MAAEQRDLDPGYECCSGPRSDYGDHEWTVEISSPVNAEAIPMPCAARPRGPNR